MSSSIGITVCMHVHTRGSMKGFWGHMWATPELMRVMWPCLSFLVGGLAFLQGSFPVTSIVKTYVCATKERCWGSLLCPGCRGDFR